MGNGNITPCTIDDSKNTIEHHPLIKTKQSLYCQKYENVYLECLSAIKESTNEYVSVCVPIELFDNLIDTRKAIYYAMYKLKKDGYESKMNDVTIVINLSKK